MYLITKWFGVFLHDGNTICEQILFPKKEKEILKRIQKIKKNEILIEEKKIIKDKEVKICEKRLLPLGEYVENDPLFYNVKIDPIDYNFSEVLFNKVTNLATKDSVDEKLKSEDLQIIQMVNALDDLIKISNMLSERLACWKVIPTPDKKIESFKNTFIVINNEIKTLESQIEEDMKKIAPNTTSLIGSQIGARLISLAGSLEKLAFLPASTVQILGAEKALFRFKKEGGKPPKHGVIFQHPLINRSIIKERGKISRMLANKISIAVKADFFTKRDISNTLKKEIEIQLKNIRNK